MAIPKPETKTKDSDQTTREQRELIERFLVAYNSIELHLRHALGEKDDTKSMGALISDYRNQNEVWYMKDGERLRNYAPLRNALVHTRQNKHEYLSVPLPQVVSGIEQMNERLRKPEKVLPTFQKPVHELQDSDTLLKALQDIKEKAYSQFPVFDDQHSYCGLLTENGIARWLANHVASKEEIVDFDCTEVKVVLEYEEGRSNWKFVSRNRNLLEVVGMFRGNIQLEAVLITQTGKLDEALLGIITRWDVQSYLM